MNHQKSLTLMRNIFVGWRVAYRKNETVRRLDGIEKRINGELAHKTVEAWLGKLLQVSSSEQKLALKLL